MSFDPRSRERLQALGRSLPQKLPSPAAPPPAAAEPSPKQARHRLETEQDPDALFRELMQASPDGTVPPHLLERLRDLESRRRPPARPGRGPEAFASSSSPAAADDPAGRPLSPRRPAPPARAARQRANADPEQQALYAAFEDLLLEDDPAD